MQARRWLQHRKAAQAGTPEKMPRPPGEGSHEDETKIPNQPLPHGGTIRFGPSAPDCSVDYLPKLYQNDDLKKRTDGSEYSKPQAHSRQESRGTSLVFFVWRT